MPFSPLALLFVFVGGGLGSLVRLFVGAVATEHLGTGFPWGTAIINVVGSTVMGIVAVSIARRFDGEAADLARFALMTGMLGGFTTFSAFSLDAVLLWQRGATVLAAGYVAGSVALSLAGLVAGMTLAKAVLG